MNCWYPENTLRDTCFRCDTIFGWNDVTLYPSCDRLCSSANSSRRRFLLIYLPRFCEAVVARWFWIVVKWRFQLLLPPTMVLEHFSSSEFDQIFWCCQFRSMFTACNRCQRRRAVWRFLAKEDKNPQYQLIVSWAWRTSYLSRTNGVLYGVSLIGKSKLWAFSLYSKRSEEFTGTTVSDSRNPVSWSRWDWCNHFDVLQSLPESFLQGEYDQGMIEQFNCSNNTLCN